MLSAITYLVSRGLSFQYRYEGRMNIITVQYNEINDVCLFDLKRLCGENDIDFFDNADEYVLSFSPYGDNSL